MAKLLEFIGNALQKYGLFPAVAILALVLGAYGCYQAQLNAKAIQGVVVGQARTDAKVDASIEKMSDRLGGVEKALIEQTTQFKLLIDGKLVVGGGGRKR